MNLNDRQLIESVFAGSGEMATLLRALDWSATPLGPVEQWPQALRTSVRIVLDMTNAGTCLRMLAADPPDLDGVREATQRTIRDGNRASDVIKRLRALFSKKAPTMESVDLNEAAR